MSAPLLLALDQGTSSTRCLALGADLAVRGSAAVTVAVAHPAPGRFEQDPEALLASAVAAVRGALDQADAAWTDVRCLAIDSQTETFVVWDRATGRALHPAVGWQDHRSHAACAALRAAGHEALVRERTGLPLDATFPPTKLRSVLDAVGGDPAGLAFGDVASWLTFRLSGGAAHVSDVANASRTSLVALATLDWDSELLALFEVPAAILPRIVACDERVAVTAADVLGGEIPIAGLIGDQQASLFGHGAWSPGEAKVTLGTGAFLWANVGDTPPVPADGIVASCAWSLGGRPTYALEGFVPAAGTVVDWLVRLGVLSAPADLDRALGTGADTGATAVPALAGLGTPSWRTDVTGSLSGLTAGAERDEIVIAMVDGVLHQVADAVEALSAAMPVHALRVDGGLCRSPRLLQRLADLTAVPVQRSGLAETTAVGTALIGALATGLLERDDALRDRLRPDRCFEPELGDSDLDARRARWRAARDAAIAGA